MKILIKKCPFVLEALSGGLSRLRSGPALSQTEFSCYNQNLESYKIIFIHICNVNRFAHIYLKRSQ